MFNLNDDCGVSSNKLKHKKPTPFIEQCRQSVCDTFRQFGPKRMRRAHVIGEAHFWRLCRILRPHMHSKSGKPGKKNRQQRRRNGALNGSFPPSSHQGKCCPSLVCRKTLMRCLSLTWDQPHGHIHCVWRVVDAVNSCPELAFRFPKDVQCKIAKGFFTKSRAGFTVRSGVGRSWDSHLDQETGCCCL